MEKQLCSGHTSDGRMGLFSCTKAGNRKYKDKWWCFHHDPREKEKKRQAQYAKWGAEQKRDDEIGKQANKLLKRLGVEGSVAYHWKLRNTEAITICFEEVEKLLKELGR